MNNSVVIETGDSQDNANASRGAKRVKRFRERRRRGVLFIASVEIHAGHLNALRGLSYLAFEDCTAVTREEAVRAFSRCLIDFSEEMARRSRAVPS